MIILKEYIQQLIVEKAVSIKDLSGVALFVNKINGNTNVILYNAQELVNRVKQELEEYGDLQELKIPILAFLRFEPGSEDSCNNSDFVVLSAAEKGYGPLAYDISMSLTRNNTLAADRSIVSDKAKNVWGFYKSNRRDVVRKDFDDQDNPRTEDPTDDCRIYGKNPGDDAVDAAYSLRSNPNYAKLSSLNASVFFTLKEIIPKFSDKVFENELVSQAEDFFYAKNIG